MRAGYSHSLLSHLAYIEQLGVKALTFIISLYQRFISPLFPATCRYHPSCSSYAVQALEKYGILRGTWKAILRVLRCNPFFPGGYDPP